MALRLAGVCLAGLLALATPCLANQGRPSLLQACAAHDLHLLTLIEDHALLGHTEPHRLANAAWDMISARAACREGNHERGLELYGAVELDYLPLMLFDRVLMR